MTLQWPEFPPLEAMPEMAAAIFRRVGTPMLVIKVSPGSPAAALGLKAGWQLLNIDSTSPSFGAIRGAELGGAKTVIVADGKNKVFEIHAGGRWPFGATFVEQPSGLKASIKNGTADFETLSLYWKEGLSQVYADLHDAFEARLSAPHVSAISRLLGKKAPLEAIATSKDFGTLLYFAVAKHARGDVSAAKSMLAAAIASRHRSGQASHSSITQSLESWLAARIAQAEGDRAAALTHARKAIAHAPEIPANRALIAELGEPIAEALPPFVGAPLPFDYDLPVRDPVNEVQANLDRVDLAGALRGISADQVVVIFLMSPYRSNYYYNLDLERLAILNRAHPGFISEIHVIVASDYALDANHRRNAEGFAKSLGLPFVILWDGEDTCARGLDLTGFPTRFVINRDRQVLATERFMEDDGFWAARSRLTQLR